MRDDGSTQPCSNLGNYCGGTMNGIKNNLDYIQNMGFDAIWITPPVDNTEGGYHGYWMRDLYTMNPRFGGNQALKDLSAELHRRNMWLMVDVVANHVGPVGTDFSNIVQFNQNEHYHLPKCDISSSDFNNINVYNLEHCWQSDLPDLSHENDYVRSELKHWINWLITEFDIDGLRVDSVIEVPKDFWLEFSASAGVYAVGEVFDGRVDYVKTYQGEALDAVLNYPMHFTLNDVFKDQQSCYNIKNRIEEEAGQFEDVDSLGLFLDNHDNPRFLNNFNNDNAFKNAFIFTMYHRGIPMMYYGGEQGYAGAADPQNREQLWTNFDQTSDWYNFVSKVVNARVQNQIWNSQPNELWVDDKLYVFQRGQTLVAIGNNYEGTTQQNVSMNGNFNEGDRLCNIFYPNDDCVQVQSGKVEIYLANGEPKVFVKQSNVDKVSEVRMLNNDYSGFNTQYVALFAAFVIVMGGVFKYME